MQISPSLSPPPPPIPLAPTGLTGSQSVFPPHDEEENVRNK